MDPKALRDLRFDVRLHNRIGWVEDKELHQELEALPDSAAKISAETADSEGEASAPSTEL